MTAMFANLPVTDLDRAKAFCTAIGFTVNFTDHNAARVVVEDGHSYFMLPVRDYFQTFTDRPIGDPGGSRVGGDCHLPRRPGGGRRDARQRHRAGGSEAHPAADYGFMYQRQRIRLHGPGRR